MTSVARHLQIPSPEMAAAQAYGTLPVGDTGSHPALGIERCAFEIKLSALDLERPVRRDWSAGDSGVSDRLDHDVVPSNRLSPAVRTDPRTRAIICAILMPDPKQHQLLASVEMQREPVPALLVRR